MEAAWSERPAPGVLRADVVERPDLRIIQRRDGAGLSVESVGRSGDPRAT